MRNESFHHRSFANVAPCLRGVSLPLEPLVPLSSDAGSGPGGYHAVRTGDGAVIVARRGLVSSHSADLAQQHWSYSSSDWTSLWRDETILIEGAKEGTVCFVDVQTGGCLSRLQCSRDAAVRSVAGGVVVLRGPEAESIFAVERSVGLLWEREWGVTNMHAAGTQGFVLLTRALSEQLVCLDATNGNERWTFIGKKEWEGGDEDQSNRLFDFAIIGEEVVAVTRTGRIYVLAIETGTVLRQAMPEYVGPMLITDTAVFFKQPLGHAAFSHRELREVEHEEYPHLQRALYGNARPTVNGFCITDSAVICTTMHGALVGVSRWPDDSGRYETWSHVLPGVLMPYQLSPFGGDGYLYYECAARHASDLRLVAYRCARQGLQADQ